MKHVSWLYVVGTGFIGVLALAMFFGAFADCESNVVQLVGGLGFLAMSVYWTVCNIRIKKKKKDGKTS